jgi:hypothetical protein
VKRKLGKEKRRFFIFISPHGKIACRTVTFPVTVLSGGKAKLTSVPLRTHLYKQ